MSQGRFVCFELMTADVEAAKRFYGAVSGWTTQAWGDNGYRTWQVGDKGIGGVNALSDDAKAMGAGPHWIANITCEDVDATVAKATSLGASRCLANADRTARFTSRWRPSATGGRCSSFATCCSSDGPPTRSCSMAARASRPTSSPRDSSIWSATVSPCTRARGGTGSPRRA